MKKTSLLLLILLAGCANYTKDDSLSKNPGILEPAAIVKFNDVPVPSGFKVLPQNSYSFESSGVRVGMLKYQGKANPDQVINFYKEQMPMYNWSLLNIIAFGEQMMNFEKENETCIVSLSSKGSTSFLTISLGPRSQTIKKTKEPIK